MTSVLRSQRQRRRQLPRQPEPRADDLDAARVRHHALPAATSSRSRGSRRRSTVAAWRSRSRSSRPSRRKKEADELLEEYRARLREAREQAEDIVARARKAAENVKDETKAEATQQREQLLAQARRDIEHETRRALDELRREVADLTVTATEKITRKSLDAEDHRRLIEEALSEVDFSELAPASREGNGN